MKIKVEHDKLHNISKAIDEHITTMKYQFNLADDSMKTLGNSGWQGVDANKLMRSWSNVDGKKTRYSVLIKEYESLSKGFEYARKEYLSAQTNAYSFWHGLLF